MFIVKLFKADECSGRVKSRVLKGRIKSLLNIYSVLSTQTKTDLVYNNAYHYSGTHYCTGLTPSCKEGLIPASIGIEPDGFNIGSILIYLPLLIIFLLFLGFTLPKIYRKILLFYNGIGWFQTLFSKKVPLTFNKALMVSLHQIVYWGYLFYYTIFPKPTNSRVGVSEYVPYTSGTFLSRLKRGGKSFKKICSFQNEEYSEEDITDSFNDFDADVSKQFFGMGRSRFSKGGGRSFSNRLPAISNHQKSISVLEGNSLLSYNIFSRIKISNLRQGLVDLFFLTQKSSIREYSNFLMSIYLFGNLSNAGAGLHISGASRVFGDFSGSNIDLHRSIFLARTGQSYFYFDLFHDPTLRSGMLGYDLPSTLWSEHYFEGCLNEVELSDFLLDDDVKTSYLERGLTRFFSYKKEKDSETSSKGLEDFWDVWEGKKTFEDGFFLTFPGISDVDSWVEMFAYNEEVTLYAATSGYRNYSCDSEKRNYKIIGTSFSSIYKDGISVNVMSPYQICLYPDYYDKSGHFLFDVGVTKTHEISPGSLKGGSTAYCNGYSNKEVLEYLNCYNSNLESFIKVSPLNATFGPPIQVLYSFPSTQKKFNLGRGSGFEKDTVLAVSTLKDSVRLNPLFSFSKGASYSYKQLEGVFMHKFGGAKIIDYLFIYFFNVLHGRIVIDDTVGIHPWNYIKHWPKLLYELCFPTFNVDKEKLFISFWYNRFLSNVVNIQDIVYYSKRFLYNLLIEYKVEDHFRSHHLLNLYYGWFKNFLYVERPKTYFPRTLPDQLVEDLVQAIEQIWFDEHLDFFISREVDSHIHDSFALKQNFDIYHDLLTHLRVFPTLYSINRVPFFSFSDTLQVGELEFLKADSTLAGFSFMETCSSTTELFIKEPSILSQTDKMGRYNANLHYTGFNNTLFMLKESVLKEKKFNVLKRKKNLDNLVFLTGEKRGKKLLNNNKGVEVGSDRDNTAEDFIKLTQNINQERLYLFAEDPILGWADLLCYNKSELLQDVSYYNYLLKLDLLKRDINKNLLGLDYLNWSTNLPYNVTSLETIPTLSKFAGSRYLDLGVKKIFIDDIQTINNYSFQKSNKYLLKTVPKRSYYRRLFEIEYIDKRFDLLYKLKDQNLYGFCFLLEKTNNQHVDNYSKLSFNTTYKDTQFYSGRFKHLLRDCQATPLLLNSHTVLPWLRENSQILVDFSLASTGGPLGWHPTANIPLLSEGFPEGSLHPLYDTNIPELLGELYDYDDPLKIPTSYVPPTSSIPLYSYENNKKGEKQVLNKSDSLLIGINKFLGTENTEKVAEKKKVSVARPFLSTGEKEEEKEGEEKEKGEGYEEFIFNYPINKHFPPAFLIINIDPHQSVYKEEKKKPDTCKFFKFRGKYLTPFLESELEKKVFIPSINLSDLSTKNIFNSMEVFTPLTIRIFRELKKLVFNLDSEVSGIKMSPELFNTFIQGESKKLFLKIKITKSKNLFDYLCHLGAINKKNMSYINLELSRHSVFRETINSPEDLEGLIRVLALRAAYSTFYTPLFFFSDILSIGGKILKDHQRFPILNRIVYSSEFKDIRSFWGGFLTTQQTDVLCLLPKNKVKSLFNRSDSRGLSLSKTSNINFFSKWSNLEDILEIKLTDPPGFSGTLCNEYKLYSNNYYLNGVPLISGYCGDHEDNCQTFVSREQDVSFLTPAMVQQYIKGTCGLVGYDDPGNMVDNKDSYSNFYGCRNISLDLDITSPKIYSQESQEVSCSDLLSKMLGDHSNLFPVADQCLDLLSKIKGHHSNLDSVMDQSISILEDILERNHSSIRFLSVLADDLAGLERYLAEADRLRRIAIREFNQVSDVHARMVQSMYRGEKGYNPEKHRSLSILARNRDSIVQQRMEDLQNIKNKIITLCTFRQDRSKILWSGLGAVYHRSYKDFSEFILNTVIKNIAERSAIFDKIERMINKNKLRGSDLKLLNFLDDKVVQRNLEDLACFIQRFNGVQYAFLKVFQKELFKERGFFWDIATPERLLVLAKDHKVSSGKFDAMFVKKGEALDSAIVASIEAFFMGDKPLKEKSFDSTRLVVLNNAANQALKCRKEQEGWVVRLKQEQADNILSNQRFLVSLILELRDEVYEDLFDGFDESNTVNEANMITMLKEIDSIKTIGQHLMFPNKETFQNSLNTLASFIEEFMHKTLYFKVLVNKLSLDPDSIEVIQVFELLNWFISYKYIQRKQFDWYMLFFEGIQGSIGGLNQKLIFLDRLSALNSFKLTNRLDSFDSAGMYSVNNYAIEPHQNYYSYVLNINIPKLKRGVKPVINLDPLFDLEEEIQNIHHIEDKFLGFDLFTGQKDLIIINILESLVGKKKNPLKQNFPEFFNMLSKSKITVSEEDVLWFLNARSIYYNRFFGPKQKYINLLPGTFEATNEQKSLFIRYYKKSIGFVGHILINEDFIRSFRKFSARCPIPLPPNGWKKGFMDFIYGILSFERSELDFDDVNIPKARNRYVWVPFFKNSIGNYIPVEWSNFDCYDISFFFFLRKLLLGLSFVEKSHIFSSFRIKGGIENNMYYGKDLYSIKQKNINITTSSLNCFVDIKPFLSAMENGLLSKIGNIPIKGIEGGGIDFEGLVSLKQDYIINNFFFKVKNISALVSKDLSLFKLNFYLCNDKSLLDIKFLLKAFSLKQKTFLLQNNHYIKEVKLPTKITSLFLSETIDNLVINLGRFRGYDGISQELKGDLIGYYLKNLKDNRVINYTALKYIISEKTKPLVDKQLNNMFEVQLRKYDKRGDYSNFMVKLLRVCDFYDDCETILEEEFKDKGSYFKAQELRKNFSHILKSKFLVKNADSIDIDDKAFFKELKSKFQGGYLKDLLEANYEIKDFDVKTVSYDPFFKFNFLGSLEGTKRLNENLAIFILPQLLDEVIKYNTRLLLADKEISQICYLLRKDYMSQNLEVPASIKYVVDNSHFKSSFYSEDLNCLRDSCILNIYSEFIYDSQVILSNSLFDLIRFNFYSFLKSYKESEYTEREVQHYLLLRLLGICNEYELGLSKDVQGYLLQILQWDFESLPCNLKEYILLSSKQASVGLNYAAFKFDKDRFINFLDQSEAASMYNWGPHSLIRNSKDYVLGTFGGVRHRMSDLRSLRNNKTCGVQYFFSRHDRYETYDLNSMIILPHGGTLKTVNTEFYPFVFGMWEVRYFIGTDPQPNYVLCKYLEHCYRLYMPKMCDIYSHSNFNKVLDICDDLVYSSKTKGMGLNKDIEISKFFLTGVKDPLYVCCSPENQKKENILNGGLLGFQKDFSDLVVETIVELIRELIYSHGVLFDKSTKNLIVELIMFLKSDGFLIPDFLKVEFGAYFLGFLELKGSFKKEMKLSEINLLEGSQFDVKKALDLMYLLVDTLSQRTAIIPDKLKFNLLTFLYYQIAYGWKIPYGALRYILYSDSYKSSINDTYIQYNAYKCIEHFSKLQISDLISPLNINNNCEVNEIYKPLFTYYNLLNLKEYDNRVLESPASIQLISKLCQELVKRCGVVNYSLFYQLTKILSSHGADKVCYDLIPLEELVKDSEISNIRDPKTFSKNAFFYFFLTDYSKLEVNPLLIKKQSSSNGAFDVGFKGLSKNCGRGFSSDETLNPSFLSNLKAISCDINQVEIKGFKSKLSSNLRLKLNNPKEICNLGKKKTMIDAYKDSPMLWPEFSKTYSSLPYCIQYVNKRRSVGYVLAPFNPKKNEKNVRGIKKLDEKKLDEKKTDEMEILYYEIINKYPLSEQEKDLQSSSIWLLEGNYNQVWDFFTSI